MITLHRNMGGGMAGTRGGGGCLETHSQIRIFKDICGMCKDKGGMSPPLPRLLNKIRTLYAGVRVMGVVDGDRSLGGGGLIAVPPLPLVGSLIACP
jgi:hypothetical protein